MIVPIGEPPAAEAASHATQVGPSVSARPYAIDAAAVWSTAGYEAVVGAATPDNVEAGRRRDDPSIIDLVAAPWPTHFMSAVALRQRRNAALVRDRARRGSIQ